MSQSEHYKILVVEDEVEMGDLITLILSRVGDDVQTATTAQQGLVMAEQYQPDLVILDLSLPDTFHFQDYEYGICHRFKTGSLRQNTPVLLMEATSPKLVYPNAKRFGASGYLVKPFDPLELLAARTALLRGELYYPLDNPTQAEEQMKEAAILARHLKELAQRVNREVTTAFQQQ